MPPRGAAARRGERLAEGLPPALGNQFPETGRGVAATEELTGQARREQTQAALKHVRTHTRNEEAAMDTPEDVKISTPTDREVVVTRTFDAPRTLVFDAYTQPELLKRWYDAPGRSLVVCEIDLRVGGSYRFLWRGEGRKDVGMRGVHRAVVRPERLVRTQTWEDWDAGEIIETVLFTERAGRTTLTSTGLYPSRDVRDAVLKAGLENGARATYGRLADALRILQPAKGAA